MRLIDADALVAKMNLAIAMLKRTMKNFDIEDDPECQMELKAYQDIRDGINEEPTIEPERRTGEWLPVTNGRGGHECDLCHNYAPAWQTGEERLTDYCPNCGAYMGTTEGESDV